MKLITLMSSGALIQLFNVGKKNTFFKNHYSESMETFTCKSNLLFDILRLGDCSKIRILKIPQIISPSKIDRFEIIIGGSTIWSIPFSLLRKLCQIKISTNYVYLCIDDAILGISNNSHLLEKDIKDNYLPLIAIQHNILQINLISELDFDYEILFSMRYYDNDKRTELVRNDYAYNINQYETHLFTNECFVINSMELTTGFFIETKNRLSKFAISFNEIPFINYNADEIELCGKLLFRESVWSKKHSLTLQFVLNKILPHDLINIIEKYVEEMIPQIYLYWIPIEPFKKWNAKKFKSNLNLINVNIKFTVNENITGAVYILGKNILMFQKGNGQIRFSN
jgi:hypothetical protein